MPNSKSQRQEERYVVQANSKANASAQPNRHQNPKRSLRLSPTNQELNHKRPFDTLFNFPQVSMESFFRSTLSKLGFDMVTCNSDTCPSLPEVAVTLNQTTSLSLRHSFLQRGASFKEVTEPNHHALTKPHKSLSLENKSSASSTKATCNSYHSLSAH